MDSISVIKSSITALTDSGKYAEALAVIDLYIKDHDDSDEAWFIRGNIFRKQEQWKDAMDSYSKAMDINPSSPAKDAYAMIVEILNFYDMQRYNA